MINFKENNVRFNYRVAGVTVYQNRVLLHRLEKDNFWALPGGRCELLENSSSAIKREYLEETGVDAIIDRPLWFLENFFNDGREMVHEISMIYKIDFPEEANLYSLESFPGIESHVKLIFKWFEIARLPETELYPTFLRERIKALPLNPEHIIHRDN